MARYQLTLAYNGALFEGFQRQVLKNREVRTVQGVLEAALRQLGWQEGRILAAGRTDAGVHATGQVIAFDLDWSHSPDALLAALNAHLPDDVAVQSAAVARPDFHPRYAARARRYDYTIACRPVRHPLLERYTWRVWPAVSLEALQEAARPLPGEHDFGAFGTPPRRNGSTVRSVYRADWKVAGDELVFEIVANGFLFRMVRRLVYAQVMVAQGKLPPDAILSRLEGITTDMPQGLAPPQGLVLAEVSYE